MIDTIKHAMKRRSKNKVLRRRPRKVKGKTVDEKKERKSKANF